MKRRIIYIYSSINMDAISCFDLEAKLEHQKLNDARFWRIYYMTQGILAKDFLYLFNNGADGGIRQQSTLPPELNREAMKIATEVYYDTKQPPKLKRKPTSFKDLKTEDIGELIALQFNKKAYHSQLNNLHKDLRAFVYDEVIADIYYLVFDMNSGIIVGGFTVNDNGELNGLFSLVKGIGKQIFSLRLEYAKKYSTAKEFTIFCIGDKLKNLYNNFGFEITHTIKWNKNSAPKNWNYDRFGTPDLYTMRKEIN